jgi:DNA-binding transcriptional regulator YbjK
MDHLQVLRDKIGSLRAEIAQIRELNEQYRLQRGNETHEHLAHGQRQDRLQEIQQELGRLATLGRKVLSAEERKEEHRSRLHLVKKAS